MKIALITELYPLTEDAVFPQSATFAIHNFCKEWVKYEGVELDVYAINTYPNKRRIIPVRKKYIRDGVEITPVPIFKIPKTELFFTDYSLSTKEYDVAIGHSLISLSFLERINASKRFFAFHLSDVNFLQGYSTKKRLAYIERFKRLTLISRSFGIQKDLNALGLKSEFIAISGIPAKEIVCRKFAIQDHINFIVVARLEDYKNIDLVIRSLAKIRNQNWSFSIIGDGVLRGELENLCQELGISNKVRFLGVLNHQEVMKQLMSSDIFVMVSNETFGLVYLEAMAKGNIVIGAKGFGIDGVVSNGVNGFLVSSSDERELVKLLEYNLGNLQQLEKVQNQSMKDVSSFTEERVAKKYFDFICGEV